MISHACNMKIFSCVMYRTFFFLVEKNSNIYNGWEQENWLENKHAQPVFAPGSWGFRTRFTKAISWLFGAFNISSCSSHQDNNWRWSNKGRPKKLDERDERKMFLFTFKKTANNSLYNKISTYLLKDKSLRQITGMWYIIFNMSQTCHGHVTHTSHYFYSSI